METSPSKKPIKKLLDELYGVTDEEIDKLILGQKIEDEEEKVNILKELVGYKSFGDYVKDHEKEFERMDISDDFKMIIIPGDKYPDISLDLIKRLGIVADHFGIFIYIEPLEKEKITRRESDV